MVVTKKLEINNLDGLNRGASPLLLQDGELERCLNYFTDRIGEKKKRPGSAIFLDIPDTDKIRSLIYFEKSNGAIRRLIRVSGANIYVHDFTGSSWGSVKRSITSTTQRMAHAALAGKLILTDGINIVQEYDGTTMQDVPSAPRGKYAATFNRRVAIWGVEGNEDRLYRSKVDDPTSWTIDANDPQSAEYWDVDPDSRGDLTGGAPIAKRLTLFKPKSAYRFDGQEFSKVPTSEGLSSNEGLKEVEDMFFYPNRAGIYGFIGDKPTSLSRFIRDYYQGIGSGEWNEDNGTLAGVAWGEHYLLSVGDIKDRDSNTYNRAVFAYNQQLNQWYLWTFAIRPECWVTCPDSNDVQQTYWGDANGQAHIFNSGTADGTTNIDTELVIPLQFKNMDQKVRLKHLILWAKPANGVKVQYSFEEAEWENLDEATSYRSVMKFPPSAVGYVPRIRLVESSSATAHSIRKLTVGYQDEGDWSAETG